MVLAAATVASVRELVIVCIESHTNFKFCEQLTTKLINFTMNNEFCWNFKKSVNRHEANVSSKINTMELDETLPERFKNINLNCDTYVKSGGDKDFNETMSKQPMHLKLLEELMQLKRKTNDNRKQLVHLKAMITELEEKMRYKIQE
ncbi:uncharacterized protein [Cardiocondyla obscurior]|uniref:uncharacterized protein n=1 Tax=Cardiocondyla obscurior TaxID=286306 RepID=UPI00396578AF